MEKSLPDSLCRGLSCEVALENAALSACAAAGGLGWQRAGELLAGAVALGVEARGIPRASHLALRDPFFVFVWFGGGGGGG